jgi:hypothetical protein
MFVERGPPGALLSATPPAPELDLIGAPLPGNRLPPQSSILGTSAQFWSFEPGWQTLELSELPTGYVCDPTTHLGSETSPEVRFVRTEAGPSSLVEYEDCGVRRDH